MRKSGTSEPLHNDVWGALGAGGHVLLEGFWGHRVGTLKDRDGNTWSLGQQVRDVSSEELEEAIRKPTQAA